MVSVLKSSKNRLVVLNERGRPIGESHPRAVLTDHEVELVLELRGEGYSLGWLAKKFECSKGCIQAICDGRNRAHLVARVRRIRGEGSGG
jgi:hypothetical protein